MATAFARCLIAAVAITAVVRPLRAEIDAQQVRDAMTDAVKYLKAKQQDRGNWNDLASMPGGVSSLCTLALLNCGESPDDRHVKRALRYLSSLRLEKTYSVALQTMVFCEVDPKAYRLQILRNARWLESQQISVGPHRGGWSYPHAAAGGGDPSNSQFALLGLYEAERAGVKIKRRTWELARGYWLTRQRQDGSWSYRPEQTGTGSMTCAGIASMVIVTGRLNDGDARVDGNQVFCCGEQTDNEAIEKAQHWLGRNFSVNRNPGSQSGWLFYYLYGVERVGRLTGQRFIGELDWYREGADMLLSARQVGRFQRYWKGVGRFETDRAVATSLALLFLSKGRRPVLLSKLKHSTSVDWNRHRADLANLTAYVEKRWKKKLTWQTIDAKAVEVEDLMQTPVLYLTGRDELKLTKEQKETLRKYVAAGGFIFADSTSAVAGEGGKGFDRDFRALMKELFKSPLRALPLSHPAYYAEQEINPKYRRVLFGIDACCRTSVIYCPENLSCHWEVANPRAAENYSADVRASIRAALQTGANVLAYATGRQLKEKLDAPRITNSGAKQKIDRGTLYVIKIKHGGDSDAAPNALPNLMQAARQSLKMRINSEKRSVALTDKNLFRYHLAFMHGRQQFRFSAEERTALKRFVDRGGFLLVDSICASREFSTAFRREMKAVFPDQPLVRILEGDAMLTDQFGGVDIRKVSRREPQLRRGRDPLKANLRKVAPQLEGIKVNDRWAVVFSPYDLSCALESRESLECFGYVRDDAARIAINAILYALQH